MIKEATDFTLKIPGTLLSPAGSNARLSILIYHRVLPEPDPLFPSEVNRKRFDLQMEQVSRIFTVIPLTEAVERLKSGTLPARAASITFDDGYADNAEIALPILKKHRIAATFFIATGYLNGGIMFNDSVIESIRMSSKNSIDLTSIGLAEYPVATIEQKRFAIENILSCLKYQPLTQRQALVDAVSDLARVELPDNLMMKDEQVKLLSDSGMEIGGHTVNHPILASIDNKAAKDEIGNGKFYLEELTGKPVRTFAYPNGKPDNDYLAAHVDIVKQLGFDAAVSTATGVANRNSDLFQLPRFTPWDRSPFNFSLRLIANLSKTRPRTALPDVTR